jgi:hypothetical protein
MEYAQASVTGLARSAAAVAILKGSTGQPAQEVCAVRPRAQGSPPDGWRPVGRQSFLEVAVFPNKGKEDTLLGVVDEEGWFKACLREFVSLKEALELSQRVPLPVSRKKGSTLRKLLDEQDLTEQVRASTLRVDM